MLLDGVGCGLLDGGSVRLFEVWAGSEAVGLGAHGGVEVEPGARDPAGVGDGREGGRLSGGVEVKRFGLRKSYRAALL